MTVYYKTRQILLQNATATLLQNATEFYYKMRQVFYYKMQQFYYKIQQLLPIATILLQNATAITKCDVYYKLRQYNLLSKKCMTEVMKSINASFTNLIRRDLARERNIR